MTNNVLRLLLFITLCLIACGSGTEADNDNERMKLIAAMSVLKCLNCEATYSYADKLEFEVINEGSEPAYVFFAMKIKTERGWKLLNDDLREASSHNKLGGWKFDAGEIKKIHWNMYVTLSPEYLKEQNLPPPSPDRGLLVELCQSC